MKKYFWIVTGLILILLTHYVWFFNWSILTNGDWNPHFIEDLKESFSSLYMWDPTSIGSVMLTGSFFPFNWLSGFLASLNINYAIIERLIYLWPTAILSFLGSYFLIKKILKSDLSAFIGSLVFSYNVNFLLLQSQHLTIAVADAFAPFVVLAFIVALEKKTLVASLCTTFLLFLLSAFEFRIYYIFLFVLFFYFIFYLLFQSQPKSFIKNCYIALVSVLPSLILNLYWLLPSYQDASLINNSILNRGLFGAQYLGLTDSLTLFHKFWNGTEPVWFAVHPIPFYFWLIPIFAFLGLILNIKNKKILFFGFISLLGVFLSKQTDIPLPSVYPWLYNHLPGFDAFREASKFYDLIALGYSVLIASFIDWLWKNLRGDPIKILIRYLLTILIAVIFLWNTVPLINGSFGTLFVPRSTPDDYLVLKNFILSQSEYFRTYWIPTDSRWGIYTNTHPEISGVEALESIWPNLLEFNNMTQPDQIIDLLRQPFSNVLFNLSSIKYVIVPLQDSAEADDVFQFYGESENPNIREWYIQQLNSIPWLRSLNIGTKNLAVYENLTYNPPIFSFTNLYTFNFLNDLNQKYSFITNSLHGQFLFALPTLKNTTIPTTHINDLFGNIDSENLLPMGTIIATTSESSLDNSSIFIENSYINYQGKLLNNGAPIYNDYQYQGDYEKISLSLKSFENTFEYQNPNYTFKNVVPDGSFQNGLWEQKVGDCNNYDKKPILYMSLDTQNKPNGTQSLELGAMRHIACTTDQIPVTAGSKYLLSFDYQSPNANNASFRISVNTKPNVYSDLNIPITDAQWHTYSNLIDIPQNSTVLSLTVYAQSTNGTTKIINRYDDFSLIKVPDLEGKFYLVTQPPVVLKEPASITFDLINPTKKLVYIKDATTPFFLGMSESYDSNWQLELNNLKVQGLLNSWWPFAKPTVVSNEYHYELDDFLNAWYVDPVVLCAMPNASCSKNIDGSYNIEMEIEYVPQRWFYLSLLISGLILAGCLGYLGYKGIIVLRKRYAKK